VEGRIDDLVAWQRLAPEARRAHPTAEHFLPLFVALGVAGAAPVVERLHASATHGSLRMDAYAFRGAVP
jgi:4,5-DOPA dioxygenase extradiol